MYRTLYENANKGTLRESGKGDGDMERTGEGEPTRVIPLLWGQGSRTGRTGMSLDSVVEAGVALADDSGVGQLTIRRLAQRLGVGAMTLYSYVPGRAELIDLMVDHVFAEVSYSAPMLPWREGLTEVAATNWALLTRHPWLVDVDVSRPPLGPGVIAKYDAELRPLVGTGLDDVAIDQALSLVLNHVWSNARQLSVAAQDMADGGGDEDWWRRAGPVLASLMSADRFPHAARVGEAAGQTYGAAVDPARAYEFGLQVILDGIEALIARNG